MTTKVRALLVDNETQNRLLIVQALSLELDPFLLQVEWCHSASAVDARHKIREEAVFDFALVDYHLGRAQMSGQVVVRELRARSPHTLIVVVSNRADEHPDFITRSLEAGADYAINRGELVLPEVPGSSSEHGWDYASLAGRIHRHLLAHHTAIDLPITFGEDIGMRSMLHSIGGIPTDDGSTPEERGKRIARSLIVNCIDVENAATAQLAVSHLAPGRSGAYVCKVVHTRQGASTRSYVVKIGLDHEALKYEKSANLRAAEVLPPEVLVRIDGNVVSDRASGYSAYAARLAGNSVTLASWLTAERAPTPEATDAVARVLFGEHLAPLFEENLRSPRRILDWLRFSPVHRLRLRIALTAYAEIWRADDGAGRDDAPALADRLRAFTDTGALPVADPEKLTAETVYVGGFGDLHSTNVLVQQSAFPRPMLVDASLYGAHHWTADATRLLVDLTLRVRQVGARSLLWTHVAEGVSYANGLCPLAGHRTPGDRPVETLIHHTLARLPEFLFVERLNLTRAVWHWQWHAALAREFVRQGARADLTPTHAVLALTTAAHHLRAATRLCDGQDFGLPGPATPAETPCDTA